MKEHLFNAKAKIYDVARPRYAQEMLDFLRDNEKLSNKKIADIGAGTGIFSKQLYELGNEIELIGLCTDICVVSNALIIKALYPEANVTVDSSCCAGVTPEKHNAALEVMKSCQITVENE